MWRAVSFLAVGLLLGGCDPEFWNPGTTSASVGSFTSVGSVADTGWEDSGWQDSGWGDDDTGAVTTFSPGTSYGSSGPGFPDQCEGGGGEVGGSAGTCQFVHWCGDRSFELSCSDGWCTCMEDGRYAGECRMAQQCAAIQATGHFNPFAPVVANCCDWGRRPGGSTSSSTSWGGSDSYGDWGSEVGGVDTEGWGESGPWRPR